MTGDCHVRFYQRLGVKLPRPTNLWPPRVNWRERLLVRYSTNELRDFGTQVNYRF